MSCKISHHRANLTRTFKTEYQPPTGGTTEQEILKQVPCSFLPGRREKGGHDLPCPHFDVKSSSAASASQPLRLPPTRAGNGCFPNTTRNRNTIPIKAKSSTPKSCCRPMPRRSTQTGIPCGTPPKPSKTMELPACPEVRACHTEGTSPVTVRRPYPGLLPGVFRFQGHDCRFCHP